MILHTDAVRDSRSPLSTIFSARRLGEGLGLGLMMLIECMQLGWLLAQKRPRAFISQKLFFFGLPLGLMTYRERSRAYAAE